MDTFILALESSEEIRDYNVEETMLENQASETRLITENSLVGFTCKSSALTYEKLQDYIDFYDDQKGSLTTFLYTSRMDNVQYEVRFEKGSFKTEHNSGVYQVEFRLRRVF